MRKLFVLVAFAFLFESCFSYKPMDNDPSKMEAGKTYKIKRNHRCSKVIFHEIKGNTILVTKDFEKKEIPINDITEIKKRKFSIVKTVLLPLSITAAFAGAFVIALSN